jgi:hypothetical protein
MTIRWKALGEHFLMIHECFNSTISGGKFIQSSNLSIFRGSPLLFHSDTESSTLTITFLEAASFHYFQNTSNLYQPQEYGELIDGGVIASSYLHFK